MNNAGTGCPSYIVRQPFGCNRYADHGHYRIAVYRGDDVYPSLFAWLALAYAQRLGNLTKLGAGISEVFDTDRTERSK